MRRLRATARAHDRATRADRVSREFSNRATAATAGKVSSGCGGSRRARPELASMVPDRRSADSAGSLAPIAAAERPGWGRHLGGDAETLRRRPACSTARAGSPLTRFAISGRDAAITAVHTALSARGYTPKSASFAGLMRSTNAGRILRSMRQPVNPPLHRGMGQFAGHYSGLVRT